MKKLLVGLLVSLVCLSVLNAKGTTHVKGAKVISAKKTEYLQRKGKALLLDARGAKLYLKGTIVGSLNLPVKKYDTLKKLLPSKDTTLITFCNGYKCEKSDELAELLIKDGYTKVLIYKGGFPEWKKKGYTVTGKIRKCKEASKGPYKPTKESKINGTKVYLGQDKGMIDQFWFTELINTNKIPKGYQLVDVRKASQYKEGHIKGAINIPLDAKNKRIDSSLLPKEKIVVFYCNTGMQSVDSFVSLKDNDNKNVLYMDANVECKGTKCTVVANENI